MAGGRRQKTARSQLRERALDAAMKVAPPKIADVCVVGGGASGLACAITAAEEGASACVLEEALECGRTILATGNGRCNFTAADLAPSFYNHPDFVESAVGQNMADEVFAFFLASGMAWTADGTRCYPLSRQAASVRDVLLARAQRAGVLLLPGRGAKKLESQCKGWKVSFSGEAGEGALLASCTVLAGGGHLAEALVPQLPRIAPEPILCPPCAQGTSA
jgi:predicted flavoprotein YhiN